MRIVTCDKCDEAVPLNNNAKLYDAALASLLPNYQTQSSTLWTNLTGDLDPTFQDGVIVKDDPNASVRNVLQNHFRGRHFHATDGCDGSPSRRRNIEDGRWGNGKAIDENAMNAVRKAYELMKGLKTSELADTSQL